MLELIIIIILIITSVTLYIKMINNTEKSIEKYSKLLSQKKSSEIVLGQVTEQLVPFLRHFKHDPHKAVFLGQPIDYVVFEDKKITFIEVKSGNSKLSVKQRKIKKLVEDKKIEWETIRVNKPTIKSERILNQNKKNEKNFTDRNF